MLLRLSAGGRLFLALRSPRKGGRQVREALQQTSVSWRARSAMAAAAGQPKRASNPPPREGDSAHEVSVAFSWKDYACSPGFCMNSTADFSPGGASLEQCELRCLRRPYRLLAFTYR